MKRVTLALVTLTLLASGAVWVSRGIAWLGGGFTSEEWLAIRSLAQPQSPGPTADPANQFADNQEAAALGQRLFFDTRFSGALVEEDNNHEATPLGRKGETGRVACASCHVPSAGFVDSRSSGHSVSLAAAWGRRRAPSLLDVGQWKRLGWDGRHDNLYNQVFGPLESPVEMNSGRLFIAQQLARHYRQAYENIFGNLPPFEDANRYPQISVDHAGCRPGYSDNASQCHGELHGKPGDRAEYDHLSHEDQVAVTRTVVNMGKALAAFERKLSCGSGRFDAWVAGDAQALNTQEKAGLKLFIGKARCQQCHTGPFFTDQRFHNVGLMPQTVVAEISDDNDPGAFDGLRRSLVDALNTHGSFSDAHGAAPPPAVTPGLLGAFKTPMLRCLNTRNSFMHTGHMHHMRQVLEFFNRGGDHAGFLGTSELKPLHLSDAELDALAAFLRSLEGPAPANALRDPDAAPQPSRIAHLAQQPIAASQWLNSLHASH